ncbi:uncharacterized protein [Diadema antillarum]|uniref:uncharacterized protein n=1 Tax=Diadema antillarum TaxID=105358 RepID=UPI003A84FD57
MACSCETFDLENCSTLKNFLPEGYSYRVCAFEECAGQVGNFSATIRLPLTTEKETAKWFKLLQAKSSTIWRVSHSYTGSKKDSGKSNIYRRRFFCKLGSRQETLKETKYSRNKRERNCKAHMCHVLKHAKNKKGTTRSTDPHRKSGYPFKCVITNIHNHEPNGAEVLRQRDVSKETRDKLP